MTAPEAAEPWVWLARIVRPQGRKGEVFAAILTDFPEKFDVRRRLWLLGEDESAQGVRSAPAQAGRSAAPRAPLRTARQDSFHPAREVELGAHWLHKGGVVLHFAGVDSISAAEQLSGLIVAIPRSERVELGEEEAYIGDLIGCLLVDVSKSAAAGGEPVPVGEIEDVNRTAGPVALLVVQGASGEVLVPFAKSYVRRIDIENKRVEMALPEGLIDLNAHEPA